MPKSLRPGEVKCPFCRAVMPETSLENHQKRKHAGKRGPLVGSPSPMEMGTCPKCGVRVQHQFMNRHLKTHEARSSSKPPRMNQPHRQRNPSPFVEVRGDVVVDEFGQVVSVQRAGEETQSDAAPTRRSGKKQAGGGEPIEPITSPGYGPHRLVQCEICQVMTPLSNLERHLREKHSPAFLSTPKNRAASSGSQFAPGFAAG